MIAYWRYTFYVSKNELEKAIQIDQKYIHYRTNFSVRQQTEIHVLLIQRKNEKLMVT